jgi:hypothetical protein
VTTTTHSYARSIALHEEAQEALAGGVNSNFRLGSHPVPLFFTRGAGAHLWDVDGNEYIDYVLGMGPNILGHAPPDVVEAVAETLSRGNLFAGQHEDEVALARLVQQTVPCAELVRFGLSGSEMDQAAIRLARAATGRKKIVKFEGHYHGWFDTVLVSTAPPLAEAGPEEAPSPHFPSAGQSRAAAADIAILPWNNLDILTHYVEAHADEIAGILMEPILINTCVIVPRPGYLEGVRALCDRHGIVLIFDEVITGFRVALGGAQARLGVTPDLAVFAKAIGGRGNRREAALYGAARRAGPAWRFVQWQHGQHDRLARHARPSDRRGGGALCGDGPARHPVDGRTPRRRGRGSYPVARPGDRRGVQHRIRRGRPGHGLPLLRAYGHPDAEAVARRAPESRRACHVARDVVPLGRAHRRGYRPHTGSSARRARGHCSGIRRLSA